eukprot:TRINITY_DN136_c0_g1_i3.p1 TRINITY_DN136_c0_g1~~TRINITY_DN136_c0_g1_i3.p1  ORF type:complete len:318 (-),score=13.43 TRINITY_DN136_c0_g1_i3:125-1051(-)
MAEATRRGAVPVWCCVVAALLLLGSNLPEVVGAKRELAGFSVPQGVSLSYPPFTADLNCSYDASIPVEPAAICTPSADAPSQIIFSYDNDVIDVRYQRTTPVQLYKKGTKYAASFSTSFVINIDRDSERSVQRVFGGGIAFAITPSPTEGIVGTETIGLFPIDQATGNPVAGQSPRTVAVEIDTSRAFDWDFPTVPHVGLDVNSLASVASRFLWNGTDFVNRKVGVFVDYDAQEEALAVRFQNITANGRADKKRSTLFLSYSGLKLSDHVNENSYVGFSSRVPVTDDGVYRLYEWKFTTKWVRTNKLQ